MPGCLGLHSCVAVICRRNGAWWISRPPPANANGCRDIDRLLHTLHSATDGGRNTHPMCKAKHG